MSTFFLILILLLGFLITFQIAKASEYVGVLKGEKKNFEANNKRQRLPDDRLPGPWADRGLLV